MHYTLMPLSIRCYRKLGFCKAMAMLLALILPLFVGCGGGSSSSSGGSSNSASQITSTCSPTSLAPGQTVTLNAGAEVLVPSGATINSSSSDVVTVNGTDTTIYTSVGAIVAVPSSAKGAATNLVSTSGPGGCVSAGSSTATVLAGSAATNTYQMDGTGTSAIFWGGGHLAIAGSGDIIVSDRGLLRQVTQTGVVTTLTNAGQGDFEGISIVGASVYGSGNAVAGAAPAVWSASVIEYLSGSVQPFAPNWEQTSSSSTGVSFGEGGLAADAQGYLYYADNVNNRIVLFAPNGTWSVFAGSGASGSMDGAGTAATLNDPTDLAIDPSGNLFFVDRQNWLVREVSPSGIVITVADLGFAVLGPGGTGAIAVDSNDDIYVAGFGQIYRLAPSGSLTSFIVPTSDFITSMTTDSSGNVYLGTRGTGAQIIKVTF